MVNEGSVGFDGNWPDPYLKQRKEPDLDKTSTPALQVLARAVVSSGL